MRARTLALYVCAAGILAATPLAAYQVTRGDDGTDGEEGPTLIDYSTHKAYCSQLPCRNRTLPGTNPDGGAVVECPCDTVVEEPSDYCYPGANQILCRDANGAVGQTSFQPSLVGAVTGLTWATGMTIVWPYAYVSSETGFDVLDITVASTPVLLRQVDTTSYGGVPITFDTDGRFLYGLAYNSEATQYWIFVYDLLYPAWPIYIGSTEITSSLTNPNMVRVQGKYLHVVSGGYSPLSLPAHFATFDITTPETPTYRGRVAIDYNSRALDVMGGLAYVVGYQGPGVWNLRVINATSDPSTPTIIGTAAVSNNIYTVRVMGRYALAAGTHLYVFDVANPTAPAVVGSPVAVGNVYHSWLTNNYLYLTDQTDDAVKVYDVSTPASPVLAAQLNGIAADPYSIRVVGRYAYISSMSGAGAGTFAVMILGGGVFGNSAEFGTGKFGKLQSNNLDVQERITAASALVGPTGINSRGPIIASNITDVPTASMIPVAGTGTDTASGTGTDVLLNGWVNHASMDSLATHTHAYAGSGTYYFDDSNSDISAYHQLLPTPNVIAEEDDSQSVVVGDGEVLIEPYATTAGQPSLSIWRGGIWQFNVWRYVSNIGGVSEIVIRVYRRTAAGAETELFNVTTGDINDTTVTKQVITSIQGDFTGELTDRLVLKMYAKTDSSAARVIHFTHNGTTHYTNVVTPWVGSEVVLGSIAAGSNIGMTKVTGTGTATGTATTTSLAPTDIGTISSATVAVGSMYSTNTAINFTKETGGTPVVVSDVASTDTFTVNITGLTTATNTITGTGSANYAAIWNGTSGLKVSSTIYEDTNSHVHIGGINSTPLYPLEVYRDVNGETAMQITNPNGGSGVYMGVAIRNDTGTGDDVGHIYVFGRGWTTSGRYIQDSMLLDAGSKLGGGLGLATSANAPIRFFTYGVQRLELDASGLKWLGTTSGSWTQTVPATGLHVSAIMPTDVPTAGQVLAVSAVGTSTATNTVTMTWSSVAAAAHTHTVTDVSGASTVTAIGSLIAGGNITITTGTGTSTATVSALASTATGTIASEVPSGGIITQVLVSNPSGPDADNDAGWTDFLTTTQSNSGTYVEVDASVKFAISSDSQECWIRIVAGDAPTEYGVGGYVGGPKLGSSYSIKTAHAHAYFSTSGLGETFSTKVQAMATGYAGGCVTPSGSNTAEMHIKVFK